MLWIRWNCGSTVPTAYDYYGNEQKTDARDEWLNYLSAKPVQAQDSRSPFPRALRSAPRTQPSTAGCDESLAGADARNALAEIDGKSDPLCAETLGGPGTLLRRRAHRDRQQCRGTRVAVRCAWARTICSPAVMQAETELRQSTACWVAPNLNGHNPEAFLRDVLARIAEHPSPASTSYCPGICRRRTPLRSPATTRRPNSRRGASSAPSTIACSPSRRPATDGY